MIAFIVGAAIGVFAGIFVMSLLAASAYEKGRDDERSMMTAYDRELERRGIR